MAAAACWFEVGAACRYDQTERVYDSSSGAVLFAGPRVRMGVHSGVIDGAQINRLTKMPNYTGRDVEIAAAVGDIGAGGQVLGLGYWPG